MTATKQAGAAGTATGPREGGRTNSPLFHCSTIFFRGKPVMHVRNGVALRRAKREEMLRRPPAWAFHLEVLEQIEAAGAHTLQVTDASTGAVYSVPWGTFVAHSVAIDRGFGCQRCLPLAYWSVNGRPPVRQPEAPRKAPTPRQLELFAEG